MFEYVDSADKGTLAWFLLFDFWGDYISDVLARVTSYAHRDVLILLQSYALNQSSWTCLTDPD
ncbi:hypothetical protein N7499_004021 [Penicillium canescens]|uniref:Uncharacterized protein n=1 Tax=Penicillium canescens TaxID=5083 RepID=A0AAD6NDN9_PENCN|nr:uncharacterized protein N7446_007533 [Penicillium canescens]KAJ6052888.1 hypothetical protein N7460_003422 [Penicillium canescens]KAJ6063413.1 hypothetical protein N7446_007533 [Penicillium canescens]KAJ6089174.1 hypothetical protein N7499_004021 [Penicillium canescens]KAJ6181543.1 hypothetical protein N7485_000185 [Penicillium canescens]